MKNYNQIDNQYKKLLKKILKFGVPKDDRTGTGTISYFGPQMRFKMSEGFPLLTLRNIHTKSIIYELLWFLASYDKKYEKFGNTNIRFLLDNGVTFWSDWPYKHYIEKTNNKISQKEFEEKIKQDDDFALMYGDLGNVYGKQWRDWTDYSEYFEGGDIKSIDQIQKVIDILKSNPDSRRIIVSAWNPPDVKTAMLPPCHMFFQFWSYEMSKEERQQLNKNNIDNFPTRKLSMKMYIRSQDFYLGNPYNIAEYSILLHMIAQITNMIPNELIYTMGDAHLYNNSIDAAKKIKTRKSFDAPKLKLNIKIKNIQDFRFEDIEIIGYKSHPNIYVPVAV